MEVSQNRRGDLVFVGVILLAGLVSLLAQSLARDSKIRYAVDCGRWTFDCVVYAIVSFEAYRTAHGNNRSTLRWFVWGFILYGLGQLLFDIEVGLHLPIFATISDPFFLCLNPCLTIGLMLVLMRDLNRRLQWAVLLDILSVALAGLTLTLAMYLPDASKVGGLEMATLTAYPVLYIVSFGVLIVTVLSKHIVFDSSNLLLAVGLIAHCLCWLFWNVDILKNQHMDQTVLNYSFSLGGVCLVLGARHWTGTVTTDPRFQRIHLKCQRLLPLLLVSAAATAMACERFHPNPAGRTVIHVGCVTLVVLAILRQSLLLFERESTLLARRKLREQEANLQSLIEYSNDVIFRVARDRGGHFRYLSLSHGFEELTGIETESALGKTPHDLFEGVVADRILTHYQRLHEHKEPVRFEQLVTTVGHAVWFDTMLIPVKNSAEDVQEIIGVSRNITASKSDLEALATANLQLEQVVSTRTEQVQSAYREIEMFSHSVSHDLQAPLIGIREYCRSFQIQYGPSLSPEAQKNLDRILSSTLRMGQIIEDLLELSRVSRSELCAIPVDLSQIAHKISQELQSLDLARSVTFIIEPEMTAQADRGLITTVLENLFNNAWKYSARQPHAEIRFGARFQDGERVFYIRDNGAGFDMEYVGKLFQAFQRLHDRHEFEGIGIGLAIVARIVQRHHGRVWATGSTGRGATFYFTLPQLE